MHPAPQDLAARTSDWTDRWYDPEARLLWNPPGSFTGELADRSVHLVPASAWYAVALLTRRAAGDHERATAVLDALLNLQYDRPGVVWHGTFARFAESPEPCEGHETEWIDYDPNWRQFVGTTLLVILRHFEGDLSATLVDRLDRALRLCVEGEGQRVTERYTNIALMKAGLEVEAGHRLDHPEWIAAGHHLADAVVARFDNLGAFDEYNSPTYYGIDLLGLALWRSSPVSPRLRTHGRHLELELWRDVARWYHPGLRNIGGPYSRSYGMDMQRYVAAVSMWMWAQLGRSSAPLPDLDAEVIQHGHDLAAGSIVALLANEEDRGEIEAIMAGARVGTGRPVQRVLETKRHRRDFSGWLGPDLMVGAEFNDHSWHAWIQYHPVTAHWRETPTSVASFRFVSDSPIQARVSTRDAGSPAIEVNVHPHPFNGPRPFEVWFEGEAIDLDAIAADHWALRGLKVDLTPSGSDRLELDEVVRVDPDHVRARYRAAPTSEPRIFTVAPLT